VSAERKADFLVVGSGMAGLWFSHRVSRQCSVLLVTKKEDTESNTNYAQGGIAAAVSSDDSAQLHCEDTLRTGGGIAHPDVVKLVTEAGPGLVRELSSLGVPFNTYADGSGTEHFDLGQEGGHRAGASFTPTTSPARRLNMVCSKRCGQTRT
jgi:L-aspartate oxidase